MSKKYNSTPAERLEFIKQRDLELGDMDRIEKQKVIKHELIEKFGIKESSAGWQAWNYLRGKETKTVE